VTLLHDFQAGSGLPRRDTLDRAALSALDAALLAAEQRVAAFAPTTFPCWPYLVDEPPGDASKERLAYLFELAYGAFPTRLRLTVSDCFDPQVALLNDGSRICPYNYWFEYDDTCTLRDAVLLTNVASSDEFTLVATAIHEFAHVLDGDLYASPRAGGTPRVDTAGFVAISFDPATRYRDPFSGWTFYRPRVDPSDESAVRSHFFSYGLAWSHPTYAGYYTAAEDFAVSVGMYVLHGAVFRDYLRDRPAFAAKYAWLRDNVFDGVEFATGDPGYAAYAPDLWAIPSIGDPTGLIQWRPAVEPGYRWDYAVEPL